MTEAAQPIPTNPANDTVPITDVNQFAALVAHWFKGRGAQIRHLLTVPEGTTFEVGEESLVLEGTAHAGFKFGVELAIMQLGELPFVAETEDTASPATGG